MIEPVASCCDDFSFGRRQRVDLRQDREGAKFAGQQFEIASRERDYSLEAGALDRLREGNRLVSEVA